MKKPALFSRIAFFAVLLSLLLLCLAAGLVIVKYGFQSHYNIQKNSLAYFLLLDGEIAGMPIVKNSSDVYFTSIPQDGTAPAVDAASIATANFAHASADIASHFQRLGYAAQTQCAPTCSTHWTKGDATIAIHLEKNRLAVVKTLLASN